MPTPQERVAAAMQFFFQTALPQATGKTFAQLSNPRVHVGAYARYAGAPIATSVGQPITPVFALRMSPPLPVAGGVPNAAGAAVPAAGPQWPILWVRQVADAGVDDEAEIRRVMADVDSFSRLFDTAAAPGDGAPAAAPAPGAAPGGGPAAPAPGAAPVAEPLTVPPLRQELAAMTAPVSTTAPLSLNASDWAHGIAASRAALAVNLSAITQVPQALTTVATDLRNLKQTLQHFFTYAADGTYYRRWSGAGRDPLNATHLTPEYKQNNVIEVKLQRSSTYLYAVVPEALLNGGADLGQGTFREIVLRFDDGDTPGTTRIATLHTAQWRRNAAPHEDFVFFHAEDGTGVAAPREVLDKLSPRLQAFVQDQSVKTPPELAQFYTDSQIVTAGPTPQAHLLGVVEGGGAVAWPPGVLASNGGPVQKLLVPPDKILAVAALPQVTHLSSNPPTAPSLDLARAMVHYPLLDAKIPVAQRGGAGVLVGIIDSGVDGSHPAFAGRLIAVWDQGNPPAVAGTSPAARHVGNAAYAMFNWGTELQGPAETVNSQDPNGHGTHVTGIAAGAEVRNAAGAVISPAGLAPAAKIVVVRSIGVAGGDPVTAVQWIFQKAQELSTAAQPLVPCVINMSFGTNDHPHDGSGLLSLQMFQQVWQIASKTYRPGRILIGAAGNERNASMHVMRQPAAGGFAPIQVRTGVRPPPPPQISSQETLTFWIKNPGPAHPAAFPLDLQVFRQANPLATTPLIRVGNATAGAVQFPGLNTQISIASSLWNPTNGDMQFTVRFASIGAINLPPDTWIVRFVNGSAFTLDIHGWIVAGWRGNSAFGGLTAADEAYQVGSPADSPGVVSVASVNSRLVWRRFGGVADEPPFAWAGTVGDLSSFSSAGPLRAAAVPMQTMYQNFEDVRAVDVTAPGCRLQSTMSRQATAPAGDIITRDPATAAGVARTFLDQGTSMASPLVAGLIANILAQEPQLTTLDVIERLKRASSIPAASAFQPPPSSEGGLKPYSKDWGYGLVDANLLK